MTKYKYNIKNGDRFHHWIVLDNTRKIIYGKHFIKCQCECGLTKLVNLHQLVNNKTKYCKNCPIFNEKIKHGKADTKEHKAWNSMKQRCYNKNNKNYKDYGGRGITVCDRWLDSFENFLEDMGYAPSKKHSIDRIDNVSGHYSKNECRWATKEEQANNRRINKYYEFNNKKLTLSQWARELNIARETLYERATKTNNIEEILRPVK